MVRAPVLLLVLALAALPAAAEEEGATVAGTTERGRSLARILDNVLLPGGRPVTDARTLVFLLDATPSLQSAGFAAEFASALDRAAPQLGETEIGVLGVGAAAEPACDPTTDRAAVRAAVDEVLARPVSTFQNLYADVRRAATLLKRHGGARDLVLVSLENGDGEDDLVGTARALRQGRITLQAVARQAFLSDTYWIHHAAQAPRGVDLHGADAAFVELPWGYLFQQGVANESVASGFPMYGLSRLAAESGGKVWLYYPPSTLGHRCSPSAGCLFCTQDHIPHDHGLQGHRLRTLAPSAGTRREALKAAAQDPAYRAVLRAWELLAKKGLVRSRPSVKRAGGGLQIEKNQQGRWAELSSTSYSSLAARADRLGPVVEAIRRDLEADLAGLDDDACLPRYRAMGETTVVLLEITRVNLLLFAAFCREVAPQLASRRADDLEPPEIPTYQGDVRFTGVGFSNLSLCHGVAPFLEVYLPGGEPVREALRALDARVAPFLDRHAHTPFAAVVRESGLARFHLTIRGKYVPPPKRVIPGESPDETTTPTDRPPRGGPTTGGGGGPTTGGE
jgi:hypothetical protein